MKAGIDFIGVGVGAMILNKENRVLMLLRNKSARNEGGNWCFPGGEVEFGETLEQAAKREAKEETGCEIEIEKLLKVVDHIILEEKQHWCNPIFKAKIVKGKLENMEPEKFEKIKWFSLEELPENLTTNLKKLFKDIKAGKIKV